MTWLVVVLAFLLLGLGVVALAFSGGGRRSGAPRRRSRGSRAGTAVIGVACLLAAVALPALMFLADNSDQARASGGVKLNAAERQGRVLFARNCSTCHTLRASNAVGRVGPNLDVLRPQQALILDAIAHGRARGAGQMPAGLLSGQDARDVAAYIAAVAGR